MIKVTKVNKSVSPSQTSRTLGTEEHEHVLLTGTIYPEGCAQVVVGLASKERVEEFKQLIFRGLNTWSDAPKWMFDLADLMDAQLPPT